MKSGKIIAFVALTLSGCLFGREPADPDAGFLDLDTSISDTGSQDTGPTDMRMTPEDMGGGGDDVAVPENCGDGALQPEEKCDPAVVDTTSSAYCPRLPEDCDDGLACTEGRVEGTPAACNAVCVQIAIEACVDSDGCCPSNCTTDTDSDCTVVDVCGDGAVTGAELCDLGIESGMGGACPTRADCAPPEICERLVVGGAAQNCNAECTYPPIDLCIDGDGCCPSGCNAGQDDDCSATCGNDVVEGTETCDGNCPVDCDDNNACTSDSLGGSAGTCDAACVNDPITMCINGDGCCPSMCNAGDDDDCSASCGDGILDANEKCDGNCPTLADCDDGDPSTADSLQGAAGNCSAECINTPITQCNMTSDGYCPPACNETLDVDCSPVCGNMVTETGETCDGNCPTNCDDGDVCTTDTLSGFAANCNATCSSSDITACVDGDGCCAPGCNATNDDDCGSVCGNMVTEPGEACDGNCPTTCNDGNACTTDITSGSPSSCSRTCSNPPITACVDGDGCCATGCNATNDSDCSASCGNGIVEGTESCDGNCPTSCTAPCESLTGSPGNCDAECTTDNNCETCSLGTNDCPCEGLEICDNGECSQTAGTCDQACQSDSYCVADKGTGYFCDDQNRNCIQCLPGDSAGDCGALQYCASGACANATSCDQANDPSEYCRQTAGGGKILCDAGNCVECLENSDCPVGSTCDNGTCNSVQSFCQFDTECGDTEYCDNNNTCQEATDCGQASNDNVWCSTYNASGWVCHNSECWQQCDPAGPSGACTCDVNGSACFQLSGTSYVVCQQATLCGQVCALNGGQNAWCVEQGTGTTCSNQQCQ